MQVAGQSQVGYTFDNANRLTQIAQGTSTVGFTYDNANRRSTLTLPNGIVATYSYDNDSHLAGISYTLNSASVGGLNYGYDALGMRTSVSGSFARTGMPQPIPSASYDAGNELLAWNEYALSYDANGNMLSDGVHNYAWDARNHLSTIDAGSTASFVYDPAGRRATKVISGTQTSFFYDLANPVQELSGSTPTANLLTGGLDEYFSRTDANGTANFLTDALGSTAALTDSTGAVQTQYTFEPFGNTMQAGASGTNSFAYTGREVDGTGLYYNRARYYSPATGRFISEDPIGLAGGMNVYAYSGDDPISFKDPTGLDYTTYQSVLGPYIWANASITIYGPGANAQLAAQWQQYITDIWNKNPGFGKCSVRFNVHVQFDPNATGPQDATFNPDYPGANNLIYVPEAVPDVYENPHINRDFRTGTIYPYTLQYSVAHEFGHLLHLFDSYAFGLYLNPWRPKDDIMNEGSVVSDYDINRVVGRGCGCK